MKHILSPANRQVLLGFASSNVLLALDYDGTLAPIVDDPEHAVMREGTRNLLERAAELYPCVVISGRAQSDAARLLHGIVLRAVVGNHGAEPSADALLWASAVRRFRPVIERRLLGIAGVCVEDKQLSLAVHFRHARSKQRVRSAVLAAADELGDVRLVAAKQAINVVPSGAPDKGIALHEQQARLGCDAAIYVGDDETDEDVFARADPERLLTVRVGAHRRSHARFYLRDQVEVDELLRALVDARATPRSSAAAADADEARR